MSVPYCTHVCSKLLIPSVRPELQGGADGNYPRGEMKDSRAGRSRESHTRSVSEDSETGFYKLMGTDGGKLC